MIEHDGCSGCKHFNNNEVTYSSPCYDCEGAHKQNRLKDNYTPMKNSDKIRAMSDEELAELFKQTGVDGCSNSCSKCTFNNKNGDCVLDSGTTKEYILEWLQSEAKEN